MIGASIAIVTTPTRLQGLQARWGTKGAAKFRLSTFAAHASTWQGTTNQAVEQQDIAFSRYEEEDQLYQSTMDALRREVDLGFPVTMVEKRFLANFNFSNVFVVIVVGHDGLVANTAKYATGLPILGVNPDPLRNDGVLTPFELKGIRLALEETLNGRAKVRSVSLAEAVLNDGQSMLAFNDFYVGKRSHTSARYTLRYRGDAEPQSSSGVIVATGAGSTGWLSSVFNMMRGVTQWTGGNSGDGIRLAWEDRRLAWVVREPFESKHSKAGLVAGTLDEPEELVLESLMPESGVIFSDGIEEDFLEFNSGSSVRFRLAKLQAKLVVPS